jgi:hypothetical protein
MASLFIFSNAIVGEHLDVIITDTGATPQKDLNCQP